MATDMATARRNAVLDGLADDDLAPLLPVLDETPLRSGTVLYEPEQPVQTVYFPLLGVVSIVADLSAGGVVESATIGREGMVGISVFLGSAPPVDRALVEVPGQALTMAASELRQQMGTVDGPLTAVLRRSTQALLTQVSRNAACNGVHQIRQRAARWLLMTADRMDSPTFELTQEFLAQMLAVRRSSVSEVARFLADDGCITYSRGSITVLDRERLQSHACDCYEVIRRANGDVFPPSGASSPTRPESS